MFILCCGFCSFLFTLKGAENIGGLLDQNDIGSWAFRQHNEICALIVPCIQNNKLGIYRKGTKILNKSEVLKHFETSYTSFIQTNPDDPTIGRDTTMFVPRAEYFYAFILSENEMLVQTDKNTEGIRFDKKQLMGLLSRENLLYLQYYALQGKVLMENIPRRSLLIVQDFNIRLHQEGKNPASRLFKTDSLLSTYSNAEKETRGNTELVAFVSTDPDDPGIGYDTIYPVPLQETLKDTQNFQGIYFILNGDMHTLHLEALSCAYSPKFLDVYLKVSLPYGFLSYKTINGLSADDKSLLESSIYLSLKERVAPYSNDLDHYTEKFNIQARAGNR